MKYKKLLALCLLTIVLTPAYAIFEDSDFNLDDFAEAVYGIEHESPTTRGTYHDSLDTLIDAPIEAHNLLKDPFYNLTSPVRRRTLLDLGFVQFPSYVFGKNLTAYPFYNQTTKGYFHHDRKHIQDYVDMKQDRVLKVLDDLRLTDFDVSHVLALFENIKIQERRLGLMFQYYSSFSNWDFSFLLPFYYQEHNFYLSPSEVKRIETDPLFENFDGDVMEFAQDHLISDKFGFGDLRMSFEKTVKETFRQQLTFGIDITIPTAFALAKGLIGTHFDKKKKRPTFDLYSDLMDHIIEDNDEAVKAGAEKFGLGALDRLSTILLENHLGNNGHFGIGLFVKNRFNFRPHLYLSTKTKCELLLPGLERRFFKKHLSEAELDAIATTHAANVGEDETIAKAELAKFNVIFLDKFFPESYSTRVFPGCSFQSSAQLTYERPNWTGHIGLGFWYHTKEVIEKIKASADELNKLNVEAGRMRYAIQDTLWIGLDRTPKEGSYLNWGIRASSSIFSYGIGHDFTIGFNLSYDF